MSFGIKLPRFKLQSLGLVLMLSAYLFTQTMVFLPKPAQAVLPPDSSGGTVAEGTGIDSGPSFKQNAKYSTYLQYIARPEEVGGDTCGLNIESQWVDAMSLDEYNNKDFYGRSLKDKRSIFTSKSIAAEFSTDGNSELTCNGLLGDIARDIYGGRDQMISELYDLSKTVDGDKYVLKVCNGDTSCPLANIDKMTKSFADKVRAFTSKIRTGNQDYYNIFLKQQTITAFNTCWKFKSKDPANHPKPDAEVKYNKDYYEKKESNAPVGFSVETYIDGKFEDGKSGCDQVFNKVKNEKLLDFNPDSAQTEILVQKKYDALQSILLNDSNPLKFCAAATGSAALKSLPMATLISTTSWWLARGSTGNFGFSTSSSRGELDAAKTAEFKKCLLSENAYGGNKAFLDILEAEATSYDTPAGADTEVKDDCSIGSAINPLKIIPNAFNWFGCVVAGAMLSIVEVASNTLETELKTPESSGQQEIKDVWSNFLVIANALFVIAFLIMILSTALNIGIVDAYTVKKLLPRIIIAAILANLSFYLIDIAISITNVLGQGIQAIIMQPVSGVNIANTGAAAGAGMFAILSGALAAVVVLVAVGNIFVLLPMLLTILLAFAVALFTIMLRRIVLLLMIVLAPVALALWVIPGLEGWTKRWWKLLIEMLLAYPFIMALMASGKFVAALMLKGDDTGFLTGLMAIFAIILPLLMLPAVFKLASSTLGNITGMVNNRGKGLIDRSKQLRSKKLSDGWSDIKDGKKFKGGLSEGGVALNRRGAINNRLQRASLMGKRGLTLNRQLAKSRIDSAQSARQLALTRKVGESEAAQAVLGNDDFLEAALSGDGSEAAARAHLAKNGYSGTVLDQAVSSITQARREVGHQAFQDVAAVTNAGTGTGYAGGVTEMLSTLNRVSGGDRQRFTSLLAQARGQAEKAKRVDLYGNSFGQQVGAGEALFRGSDEATVREAMMDRVIENKSAGEIGTARNGGLKNVEGALTRRLRNAQDNLATAQAGGDATVIATAEREHKRVLASTANMLDAASSASPENAAIVGQLLNTETKSGRQVDIYQRDASGKVEMENYTVDVPFETRDADGNVTQSTRTETRQRGKVIGKRAETWSDQISANRSDETFGQYRREYGGGAEAEAEARARGLGAPAGPPPEDL